MRRIFVAGIEVENIANACVGTTAFDIIIVLDDVILIQRSHAANDAAAAHVFAGCFHRAVEGIILND